MSVPIPSGEARARVVMLGETYEHQGLSAEFLDWVQAANVLAPDSVIVEWLDGNPFAHNDPNLAPVGDFMFTTVDEWLQLEARAAA
ncbi:hypothetical protein FYK61_21595 [Xanthomonas citri]|uniref:hypothetical protein n=1 Tax=Xanthomonas citri TaxID=346 RepID=UPI000A7CFD94|nr:hypothetical protein [Xanthomonas citri]QOY23713.1 hypothetical protein FYK61_21595 [Xanthomonas citri]QQK69878.1 hypothetical protein G3566_21500 [Xanthomonas citri]